MHRWCDAKLRDAELRDAELRDAKLLHTTLPHIILRRTQSAVTPAQAGAQRYGFGRLARNHEAWSKIGT